MKNHSKSYRIIRLKTGFVIKDRLTQLFLTKDDSSSAFYFERDSNLTDHYKTAKQAIAAIKKAIKQ